MAQRLVRAKRKIRNAGIPYRVPPASAAARAADRACSAWCTCCSTRVTRRSAGEDLVRQNLSAEAIRLGRVLVVAAAGRAGGDGPAGVDAAARRAPGRAGCRRPATLVTLEDQDRTLWDAAEIAAGEALLDAALRHGRAGPVPGAGGDRGLPRDRAEGRRHRLAADRVAVRGAAEVRAVTGGGAEPRGRGGDGRRPGRGAGAGGRPATCRTTTCCRRPARTCCAASAGTRRRLRRTGRRCPGHVRGGEAVPGRTPRGSFFRVGVDPAMRRSSVGINRRRTA